MVKCRSGKCAVYSHKTGKRLTKMKSKKSANKDLQRIHYFSKVKGK